MPQIHRLFWGTVLVTAVSLTASPPAHAHIEFEEINDPQQPNQANIFFDKNASSGTTLVGSTSTNKGDVPVSFSSTESLIASGNGQAYIVAADDGNIENLTITVPGGFYTGLILDPQTIVGQDKTPGGTADVSVVANDGLFTHSYNLGNGSNYLTIIATGGESILSTTLNMEGAGSFADLKQPRISGAAIGTPTPAPTGTPTDVAPEPCTLALLGAGALPLLRLRRRARKA